MTVPKLDEKPNTLPERPPEEKPKREISILDMGDSPQKPEPEEEKVAEEPSVSNDLLDLDFLNVTATPAPEPVPVDKKNRRKSKNTISPAKPSPLDDIMSLYEAPQPGLTGATQVEAQFEKMLKPDSTEDEAQR